MQRGHETKTQPLPITYCYIFLKKPTQLVRVPIVVSADVASYCDGKGKPRRVEVSPQAGVQGARGGQAGQIKDGRSQRNGGLFIINLLVIYMGYGARSNYGFS